MPNEWMTLLNADLKKLSDTFQSQTSSRTEVFLPGERRDVAILFLDLKNYTDLSEKLDHETVHQLVTSVMSALARVVEGYGGIVDKFEGDLIMALFGAKQASENDCIRAVAAAMKMMETFASINEIIASNGLELNARIGINYGSVTVAPDPSGHYTVTGDEVNQASRMESSAEVNTIQCTERVFKFCGDEFAWKDLGEITVKGKRLPIHAYRVLGPGTKQQQRWNRAANIANPSFAGRQSELSWLHEQWQEILHSDERNRFGGVKSTVVSIVGEAGIGKSRLVRQFLKEIQLPDGLVLNAQALSFAQPAYWLWSSLLRDYFNQTQTDSGEVSKVLSQLFGAIQSDKDSTELSLQALFDLLGLPTDSHWQSLEEKAHQQALLVALRLFLQAVIIDKKAVILVLEDLHWVDDSSLDALHFVLNNIVTDRPLILFELYRPEHDQRDLPDFTPSEHYTTHRSMTLAPLPETAVDDLLQKMLALSLPNRSAKIDRDIYKFIYNHSQGNPYFLEELVVNLLEQGTLIAEGDKWTLTVSDSDACIPSTLSGLLRSRIDRLPIEQKQLLQSAAVIGMKFSHRLFSLVSKKFESNKSYDSILDQLVQRNFLSKSDQSADPTYAFKHVLIRNVSYDTLLRHNRILLHRIVAQALIQIYPDPVGPYAGIIAFHWMMAEDNQQAIVWGIHALRYSQKKYQNTEGLRWSSRLLHLLENDQPNLENNNRLFEVLALTEQIETLRGNLDHSRQIIAKMALIANLQQVPQQLLRLHFAQGGIGKLMGSLEEAQYEYELALEQCKLIDDKSEECGILNQLGILYHNRGLLTEAQARYEQALAISRESGNRWSEGVVLGTLGILHHDHAKLDLAEKYYTEALEITRQVGNRQSEAFLMANLGTLFRECGKYDESNKHYQAALLIARDVGNRNCEGVVLGNLAGLEQDRGNISTAAQYYQGAMLIHREVGNRWSEGIVLGNLGNLEILLGNFDAARSLLEAALTLDRELGNREFEGSVLASLGYIYQKLNDSEIALHYYQEALTIHRDIGDRRYEGMTLADIGVVYYQIGELKTAMSYLTQALAIHREIGNRRNEGVALGNIANIERDCHQYESAEAHYRQTIELFSEINAPLEYANNLSNFGQLLIETNRLDNACEIYRSIVNLIDQANLGLVPELSIILDFRIKLLELGKTEEELMLPTKFTQLVEPEIN